MEHLYFLKTLDWRASGTYYDDTGAAFPLSGEVSVRRSDSQWTLSGFLQVHCTPALRFTNRYVIRETEAPGTLAWESYNPALGTLKGTFEFIGGSIVSFYQSDDGVYSGTETLVLRPGGRYENVGVSFCRGRRMSAWTAELHSTEPAAL